MNEVYCYKMTKSVGQMTTIVLQKIVQGRKYRLGYALVDEEIQDMDFSSVAYPMPGVIEYNKDKAAASRHFVDFNDIGPIVFDEEWKKLMNIF